MWEGIRLASDPIRSCGFDAFHEALNPDQAPLYFIEVRLLQRLDGRERPIGLCLPMLDLNLGGEIGGENGPSQRDRPSQHLAGFAVELRGHPLAPCARSPNAR